MVRRLDARSGSGSVATSLAFTAVSYCRHHASNSARADSMLGGCAGSFEALHATTTTPAAQSTARSPRISTSMVGNLSDVDTLTPTVCCSAVMKLRAQRAFRHALSAAA